MTHKLLTPAASLAAIAAALTIANPALSQPDAIPPQGDAAPGAANPVIVPPPVVSAPPVTVDTIPPATAPQTQTSPFPTVTPPAQAQTQAPGVVYKPSAPVVQDVPVTEEASPAEEAALAGTRSSQPAASQARNEAPRRESPAPATTSTNNANEQAAATPPAESSPESGEISPLTAPGYTGAANSDLARPAQAEEAQAGNADLSEGVIIGGAAILLLGTGVLAWTALRRRRPADRTARPVVADTSRSRPADVPATAVAPLAVAPVAAGEPVRREEVSAVAATAPEAVAEAVAPVTPAEVHARDADMTVLERPVARNAPAADTDLEAMVAAQPDAANPFLTRRNRLRRAKYILEHGEYVSRPISQREETRAAAKQAATNQTPSRSQPPVYDFGKGAAPHRRSGWKPATST